MNCAMSSYEKRSGNYMIKYKLTDVEKISKSDLEDMKDDYAVYDLKVKKAKKTTFDVTVSNKYGSNTTEITVYVVKIGAKWYMDISNTTPPIYALYLILGGTELPKTNCKGHLQSRRCPVFIALLWSAFHWKVLPHTP